MAEYEGASATERRQHEQDLTVVAEHLAVPAYDLFGGQVENLERLDDVVHDGERLTAAPPARGVAGE
jgi:hypothetical protein